MENRIKIFLLILIFFFLFCKEEYFLVDNSVQLKEVKKTINDFNWKITAIDTFWNLDGLSILRYRITFKPGKSSDSLIYDIKQRFQLNDY